MAILRRNKTPDPGAAPRPAVTKRSASGRATPKGTTPTSGRYTPPTPKVYKQSPTWVPVLMLTFFVLGMVVIIFNYLPGAVLLPGDSNNWYLLLGLGLITAGFITATKYR